MRQSVARLSIVLAALLGAAAVFRWRSAEPTPPAPPGRARPVPRSSPPVAAPASEPQLSAVRAPVEPPPPSPAPGHAKDWSSRVRGRAVLEGGGHLPSGTFVSLLTGRNEIDHAETVARLGGLARVNDLRASGKLSASAREIGGWKRSLRARVDRDGDFEIAVPSDLPRFQIEVESDFAAYPDRDAWFTLASAEGGIVLELERGGRVEGALVGPEGLPFDGTQVSLVKEGKGVAAGRCDPAGRVEIHGVPPGTYDAVASVQAVGLRRREGIEVRAGETARFELRIEAGRSIRGVVLDAAGRGVEDAGIRILLERPDGTHDAGKGQSTRTGPEGAFFAGSMEPGRYTIFVDPAGGRLGHALPGVEVPDSGNVDGLRITLPTGRFLAGRVVDAAGKPVEGARVEARADLGAPRASRGSFHVTTESGPGGAFRIDGLGETIFAVEASRGDLSGVVLRGIEGDRDDLVLSLPPPTGIAGRVLGDGGTTAVRRFSVQTILAYREGSAGGA
ncbi:MAG TPA: carboxypeptidase-like regulatory domain-containing protein, partial [Planctomycetota bacterium]|nr:carboxypeptidase-like regulatory domain-containing protein [Planctomycetota bacterium]